jgi:hypothetical protein
LNSFKQTSRHEFIKDSTLEFSVLIEGFIPGMLTLYLSESFDYCLTINLEQLKSTKVPVKEIKNKNSPEVLGEKQTSGSLVVIQECDDCKCFVSINIL